MDDKEVKELIVLCNASFRVMQHHVGGESAGVGKLLNSLEQILKFGMKEKVNGSTVTLWNFLNLLCNIPSITEICVDMKREIEEVYDWPTEEAKSRGWMRLALNHKKITLLKYLLEDRTIVSDWYESKALARFPESLSNFSNILVGLETLDFDLPITFVLSI
eukprot:TRINITY_DN7870_c0_g1_i4.p1 TRINITY_DN7870_c0_g1~~TRINITY_DN7870_c0_g1_i4.p1  ORF type:complete len:177 (-),score=23.10 TRINITY_DN7870_c0_g1_i4:436-921(-)